jgi:hypothetical protein
MTDPGATAAGSDRADLALPGRATSRPPTAWSVRFGDRTALLLVLLAGVWLAAMLWVAHAEIAANATAPTLALVAAAQALPALISASLVAGAATGAVAVGAFAPTGTRARRAVVGLASGAVLGLVSVAVITLGYGRSASILSIAATIGLGAVVGGGAAATLPRSVLVAGVAATLSGFGVGVLLGHFQSPIKSLIGQGSSIESLLAAATRFFYLASAVGGLIAGLVGYAVLRHRQRVVASAGDPPVGWPGYLVAGGLPGIVALVAWIFTMLGGARLLGVVSGLSPADRTARSYLDAAGLNHALIVGFLGAIVATVAFGRTLGPARSAPSLDDDGSSEEG